MRQSLITAFVKCLKRTKIQCGFVIQEKIKALQAELQAVTNSKTMLEKELQEVITLTSTELEEYQEKVLELEDEVNYDHVLQICSGFGIQKFCLCQKWNFTFFTLRYSITAHTILDEQYVFTCTLTLCMKWSRWQCFNDIDFTASRVTMLQEEDPKVRRRQQEASTWTGTRKREIGWISTVPQCTAGTRQHFGVCLS